MSPKKSKPAAMKATPAPGSAFHPPQAVGTDTGNPVADFDIEAWRAGKRIPTRIIPVTNDPGAGLRLTQLRSDLAEIRREVADAKTEGRRVAGARAASTSTPTIDATAEEIRQILTALDGTWTYIHIRALDAREAATVGDVPGRIDRIVASLASTDADGNPAATISGSETHPGTPLSAEQWHGVIKDIGAAQTMKVEAAVNELTFAAVTPDFSRRVSSLLDGQTSSSS